MVAIHDFASFEIIDPPNMKNMHLWYGLKALKFEGKSGFRPAFLGV